MGVSLGEKERTANHSCYPGLLEGLPHCARPRVSLERVSWCKGDQYPSRLGHGPSVCVSSGVLPGLGRLQVEVPGHPQTGMGQLAWQSIVPQVC